MGQIEKYIPEVNHSFTIECNEFCLEYTYRENKISTYLLRRRRIKYKRQFYRLRF